MGQKLVEITATAGGNGSVGRVSTYDGTGQDRDLVTLGADKGGNGKVNTYDRKGQALVTLAAFDGEGVISVSDPSDPLADNALPPRRK